MVVAGGVVVEPGTVGLVVEGVVIEATKENEQIQ